MRPVLQDPYSSLLGFVFENAIIALRKDAMFHQSPPRWFPHATFGGDSFVAQIDGILTWHNVVRRLEMVFCDCAQSHLPRNVPMRKPGSRGMHRNTFSADQWRGTRS